MELIYLIAYVALIFLVARSGEDREIGIGAALMISIFLTPLVGFMFVAISKRNDEIQRDQMILHRLKEIQQSLKKDQN